MFNVPSISRNLHIKSIHGSGHAVDELRLAVVDVHVHLTVSICVLYALALFYQIRKLSLFKIVIAKFVFGKSRK